MAIAPGDRYIASGGNDSTVKLWDLQTGACLQDFSRYTLQIWAVAFSPDGTTLASSSMDQTVRLWHLADQQCVACLRGHSSMVTAVAFSPDGRILASGGLDRLIKHWDVERQVCLRTWAGFQNILWSVAFSPDGQKLASSSMDGTVRIWDANNYQHQQTLKHPAEVHAIAFSPDGTQLVSGNLNTPSTLKIWDLQQGDCFLTLPAHVGKINSVSIHPTGAFIASGGDDKEVQILIGNNNRWPRFCKDIKRSFGRWLFPQMDNY